ncbi:MAG: AarF/UbiB family protein [bacterium]
MREALASEIRNALRYVRANWLVAKVLASYIGLYTLYKLFGADRIRARIDRTHERNAQRVLDGILELKAVYIKLGQVLSVMSQVLPPVFSEKLVGLQDAVPPHPYKDIERRFREEFGKTPQEMGLALNPVPLASASLGQVHRATDPDGRVLAIKVQYPDIEKIVEMDLAVLARVTRILDWFFPDFHYHRIREQIVDVVRRELDYRSEARNMATFAANFADDPDVLCPEVVPEYTSGRVLAMTFMEGCKIGNRKALIDAGIDPQAVVKKLAHIFFKQVLKDRLFHADPHPGNFLVQPGPKIVVLDFGAVEPIREELMKGMRLVFLGYISRNDQLVLNGVEVMGFKSLTGDRAVFERSVKHYFEKILRYRPEDLAKMSPDVIRDFADLKQLDVSFTDLARAFQYPEGYFYIERTMLLLLGLCMTLDYTLDPLIVGAPYAMQLILETAEPGSLVIPPPPAQA